MQHQQASHTALATAYLRAAHQILDAPPLILEDPAVLVLLGTGTAKMIQDTQGRYRESGASVLRSHVVLRSRYTEDRLKASMARGLGQYIIVGAGFDTFVLRQPDWAARLSIVEIDHPDTQRLKKEKISDSKIRVPGNVYFAEIDFEKESLAEGLTRNGIRKDIPTFFSWLGVTMYLTESAIDATLKCMAKFPTGSEAVITFRERSSNPSLVSNRIENRVMEIGEPFVSSFALDQFKDKLRKAGFTTVEMLTPQLAARYFHSGENSLPIPKQTTIAAAMV